MTSLYKPIKLVKLKLVFGPELHYMRVGLTFLAVQCFSMIYAFNPFTTEARFYVLNAMAFST